MAERTRTLDLASLGPDFDPQNLSKTAAQAKNTIYTQLRNIALLSRDGRNPNQDPSRQELTAARRLVNSIRGSIKRKAGGETGIAPDMMTSVYRHLYPLKPDIVEAVLGSVDIIDQNLKQKRRAEEARRRIVRLGDYFSRQEKIDLAISTFVNIAQQSLTNINNLSFLPGETRTAKKGQVMAKVLRETKSLAPPEIVKMQVLGQDYHPRNALTKALKAAYLGEEAVPRETVNSRRQTITALQQELKETRAQLVITRSSRDALVIANVENSTQIMNLQRDQERFKARLWQALNPVSGMVRFGQSVQNGVREKVIEFTVKVTDALGLWVDGLFRGRLHWNINPPTSAGEAVIQGVYHQI